MSKFHISPSTGEAKPCKAELECPFGSSMPHFQNKQEAQAYFENIMEEKPKKSIEEKKLLKDLEFDNMDTVIAINDARRGEISINGEKWEYFDQAFEQKHSQGNSKAIADYISEFSQPMPDDEEEYFIPLKTLTYEPIGEELKEHSANIFTHKGQEYVIDFAYSEINPNAEYPYIDTVENWQKDLNKISFIGVLNHPLKTIKNDKI